MLGRFQWAGTGSGQSQIPLLLLLLLRGRTIGEPAVAGELVEGGPQRKDVGLLQVPQVVVQHLPRHVSAAAKAGVTSG